MLLTAAICTRNRAASLRRALASLVGCAPPSGAEWEVVVVDNGSTDDTPSVVRAFEGALPLRATSEPARGLAHARNAAVRAAHGEYMLWTDDDCEVDRQWIAGYAAAFQVFPGASLFGGPIAPRFDGEPPAWLRQVAGRVATAYAARDLGPDPVALALEGNRVPFGANYAVRSTEQRSRPYDARLGRGTPLPVTVGEESEVLEGLLRDGAEGRWVPAAGVTHCIPPERQTIAYLREYFEADGAYEEWRRHMVLEAGDSSAGDASRFQLFRRALRGELRYRILRGVSEPGAWIDDLIAASVARGRARARRALAVRARG